ncbi:hypothetical protein [Parasphingorhabdus sp.]|uniref:hypothetical protein n=1 Tax=Parasphingorhabdus sp. TaxID=2709688 RepID=UPI003A95A01F
MGNRKETLTDFFSYTTIAVSVAVMSGLALGHVTEQSMHPRLSVPPPADPVERYALGQNAYQTRRTHVGPVRAQGRGYTAEYRAASYEIGRYEKGARILMPEEPARKIERTRLEKLQAWNEQNFGSDEHRNDEHVGDGAMDRKDYQPIDVGAVMAAPESEVQPAARLIRTSDNVMEPSRIAMDAHKIPARGAPDDLPVLAGS